MKRHWILVFVADTFILWQQLTSGVRRRWATKPLQIIAETLEAFRTAVEFRLVHVFAARQARFGYVWA